jgi:hypothetical protein
MHLLAVSGVDLRKHLFAIVLLASLAPYQVVHAQQYLHFPSPELAIPGVAQKSPIRAPTIDASAYANLSTVEALATRFKDAIPHSAGDVILFRQAAPSVVFIRTKDAPGSGSLLQDNVILTSLHVVDVILTSLHVVDHNREVTVVFKPANRTAELRHPAFGQGIRPSLSGSYEQATAVARAPGFREGT